MSTMGNPGYTIHPSEARASEALAQLALDLCWSWNHAADELWRRLDEELWELTPHVVPKPAGISVPLGASDITWQF